jgi:outer membrane protein W
MNKKIMMLALAAVSAAMFALPAVASAEHVHISAIGEFGVTGGAGTLTRADGNNVTGTGVTGKGKFTTTTTGGDLTLTFTGAKSSSLGVHCQTTTTPTGIIHTTELEFHLITVTKNVPGILITSNAGHFATFECAGATVSVTGPGILGELTKPKCGEKSVEATLSFAHEKTGTQKHTTWTGTKYDLESTIFGVKATSALDLTATIKFTDGVARELICT